MKTFLLTILSVFLLSLSNTFAQNPTNYDASTKTFTAVKASKASNDIETSYKWKDSKGVEYTIYLHKYTRGENAGKYTCFVFRTSKNTGKEYKYYIPNGMEIANEIKSEYIKEQ
jgi:hypothetical protein